MTNMTGRRTPAIGMAKWTGERQQGLSLQDLQAMKECGK